MGESAFTAPYFELHGTRELFLDGACTLLQYAAGEVVLLCGGLRVRIRGTKLQVALLSPDKAVISGSISGFDFV